MATSRGSRESAFERVERARIEQALLASQAEVPSTDQQHQLLPPLPLATPFQTLHGTLDNTTTTSGGASGVNTSRSLGLSSSSDQIIPSSVNPLQPFALPSLPTHSNLHSSISNSDTAASSKSKSTDEIRNSFTTSDQSTRKQVMSSEIENSTNSGGAAANGGAAIAGEGGDDVVPDSDNEGSNSASFPLGGGRGGGAVIEEQLPRQDPNPTIEGLGRLPTLPKSTKASASKSTPQRPFVEIPAAGDRTISASKSSTKNSKSKATTSKGKGKESMLSKETVDSEDEEGDEVVVSSSGPRSVKSKEKQKGKKRTIAIEESDDDGSEAVQVKPTTSKKNNKKRKTVDPIGEESPLTDYDEPNLKSTKPKARTSSTSASLVNKKSSKAILVPPSSPDPISAPLETSTSSSKSKSAPLEPVIETSTSSNGKALERRLTDQFQEQAMQVNERQEEKDADWGFDVLPTRQDSKNKSKSKSVDKTKGRAGAVEPKKGGRKKKGTVTEEEQAAGVDESKDGELEEEAEVAAPTKAKAVKGKAKEIVKKGGRKKKKGVVESEEEEDPENDGLAQMNLDDDEPLPDVGGSSRSPRANKGKAKKRLDDSDHEPEGQEEAQSPPSKKRTVSSKAKGKKKAIETAESEAEDGLPVVDSSDVDSTSKGKTSAAQQQPTPSASTIASTSTAKQKKGSVSPAVSRTARANSSRKSGSPAVSRGRTMSTEEKKADREKRMNLVMEAAQEEDPDTFKFMTQEEKKAAAAKSKDKEKKQGSKRKAVNSDSDADDESELSEAEEAEEDEDSENDGKAKGKARVDAAKKGQASKENEGVPTPKPKSVAALARGRDRSASPFSKTPRPGSLADIIAKRGIGSYRSPGLSARAKVPSLHRNLKPPPAPQRVIQEKRPVKKKKKGEYSCSDEEKPWWEIKDPEEWDSDDHARWNKRQQRIEKGLPADSDDDSN